MRVNRLLAYAGLKEAGVNHPVHLIADDSRICCCNCIYVCCSKDESDQKKYVEEAILNGARTIVSAAFFLPRSGINFYQVEQPTRILAKLLRRYYGPIVKRIHLIGVIGTNGKTTTSTLGYEFFRFIGKKAMLIGSNGIYFGKEYRKTENTTPSLATIYRFLVTAAKNGIRFVFMEVSSIAVEQLRVFLLPFDCLIFTNFSEDHLDYHKTMEQYLFCKLMPFLSLCEKANAVVNADDPISRIILKYTPSFCYTIGLNGKTDYTVSNLKSDWEGLTFTYRHEEYHSCLMGRFNIYNLLSILPLCEIYGVDEKRYFDFLNQYQKVSGRMNKIKWQEKCILLDYAHTEQAVQQVVKEAQSQCRGRLYLVLGCGGNREKEKRYHIGRYLNSVDADIILTTDNPRYEDPLDIVKDIQKEMVKDTEVILDRKTAIETVLSRLKPNDWVLILGKGAEKTMEIRGIKYPFNDEEVIYEWICKH